MDAAAMAVGEKHQTQPSPPGAAVSTGEKSGGAADGTSASVMERFRREHGEFLADLVAMSACGVTVESIVFLPDGLRAMQLTHQGAAAAPTAAQAEAKRKRGVQATARALTEKDVSKMTLEEAKKHREQLLGLRAIVVRKLQEKAAAINVDDDGDGDAAGRSNKVRRIDS